MGIVKPPNYRSGHRGKNWTRSLRAAQASGAVIVVEETGVPVTFNRPEHGVCLRLWRDRRGNRYDSRDCIPVW